MVKDAFDRALSLVTDPQVIVIALWVGLGLVTVGLFVLMRTRWGQTKPLGKCVILSLFVHLLLAVYAASVQIVAGGGGGSGDAAAIRISLSDGTDELGQDFGEESLEGPTVERPWEKIASEATVGPETKDLVRSDDVSAPSPERASVEPASELPKQDIQPLPDTLKPKLDDVAADLDSSPKTTKEADSIETPQPKRDEAANLTAPAPSVPERAPEQSSDAPSLARDTQPEGLNPAASLPPSLEVPSNLKPPGDSTSGEVLPRIADGSLVPVPGRATSRSGSNAAATDSNSTNVGSESGSITGGGLTAVPAPYSLRVAPGRSGLARGFGSSAESESAVDLGLKWLAANQSREGRWVASQFGAGREMIVLGHDRKGAGAKADTGVTGLALLSFLGSGHTHRAGEYAATVQRALDYLQSIQGRDGSLGGQAEPYAYTYCHGMATLAIAEAYGMTKDSRLEPALRRAVAWTAASQIPQSGSWRYQPHEKTGDTSQLGWQLMALKSAELAGVQMPESTRSGMVRFLKSVETGRSGGLASYRPNERPSRAMTAEALVCRQFLGMSPDNPAAQEATEHLLGELPAAGRSNLYYWYYATLGLYQMQGDDWRRWNESMQTTLVQSQETRGDLAGSWNPDNDMWGCYGGRIYSTAMATLCLEVYYRYLPLYAEAAPRDVRRK